jgi:hypothetical protein
VYSASPERGRPSSSRERLPRSRSRRGERKSRAMQQKLCGPLPLSETGQRLAKLFPNGWDWIYADAPSKGSSVEWETIKKFPLSPVEQWTLHQDPSCVIGIRPNSSTRWGIIDIDATSKYHPTQDRTAITTILDALEDIGLCRTLINQSSHNGGLHIYVPLPEALSSFGMAVVLKYTLEAAGIQLRSGQCETFPNPKRYVPQGFSVYNGIRMPMQPNTGFFAIDSDLNPLPWSLEDWLDTFETIAQHQDLERLHRAIADAEHNHRIRGHRNPHSLESWSERIEIEKQGWSGPGQTNDKLKIFACEARVFLGMDSITAIAAHIEQLARATPGFYEHSSHAKDLGQRSRDVAIWAMRYYWPMGAHPSRDTGYNSQPPPPADFSYHQAKREAAQHRIRQAVIELRAQDQLPATATARAKAIAEHAHISQQTLYKDINKPLWHPDYRTDEDSVKEAEPQSEQDITPELEITPKTSKENSLQPLINKRITQLYLYEGFVTNHLILGALEALAHQGQRATQKAQPNENSHEWGGSGGDSRQNLPLLQGWEGLRQSLPLSMQAKIAKVQRSRQRKDELEQKRRERAEARRRQLKLDLESRPRSPEELAVVEQEVAQIFERRRQGRVDLSQPERQAQTRPTPTQDALADLPLFRVVEQLQIGEGQENLDIGYLEQDVGEQPEWSGQRWAEVERLPCEWERDDFNEWYSLAVQFKLVTDYQWRELEYWVLVNGVWRGFCEMMAMFSGAWLRRKLEKG